MSLKSLMALPRLLRHGDRVGADLPPDEAVVLDAPDPELGAALDAARADDSGPLRALLARTRTARDWEYRGTVLNEASAYALHHPGWLDSWPVDHATDPDALLVRAELAIDQAWEVRTAYYARHVSDERFRQFHQLLEEAGPVLEAAAHAAPDDPLPWAISLSHAMGLQLPREEFDHRLAEALRRDPHHHSSHNRALQFLCAKWRGSHEEMFAFAERAAEAAPPDSRLHALPLMALYEYDQADQREGGRNTGPISDARCRAALDRALALSARCPADDHRLLGIRNHLADQLFIEERWEEALDMFRLIGVHARSFPWEGYGEPRQEFLEFRSAVCTTIATNTPFFGTPPAPRSPVAPAHAWNLHSLALCAAPLPAVVRAGAMCRRPLRVAPVAPGAEFTWLESADSAAPSGTALGAAPLTDAVAQVNAAEKWHVLLLHHAGGRCGFALYRKGDPLAEHWWDPTAEVPALERATELAATLARAFPTADTQALTGLLRTTDAPPHRPADLLAALRVPAVPGPPPGFGSAPECLTPVPGARLLRD